MKLNLKMNLSLKPTDLKRLAGKYAGPAVIVLCGGLILYTGYFLSNLVFGATDTTELERKQAQSDQAKQIRFNDKILTTLDALEPAASEPDTSNVGRNNPFTPN